MLILVLDLTRIHGVLFSYQKWVTWPISSQTGPNNVSAFQFPIISTKHHLLPSPQGELAPAIEAILDIYGTEVLVLVSHNGQGTNYWRSNILVVHIFIVYAL